MAFGGNLQKPPVCCQVYRRRYSNRRVKFLERPFIADDPCPTKETNDKKALKIAEEFERAAKTKRTLKQVQNVLDRLHEEVSGQRVVRTTFREYLSDWLMAKKAETASSTMDFYQTSLRKFVQFLGQRADEPIGEITKQEWS